MMRSSIAHRRARSDLHAAAVRPLRRDHLGGAEQLVQRHAILGWDMSFRQYDFAKGATISVIMIVFVMIASIVYVRSTRHEVRG
jgi:hypothetical protein